MNSNARLRCRNLPFRGTFSGIYALINNVNGRFYIGSSVDVLARVRSHRHLLRKGKHANAFLQADWKKHREENYFAWFVEGASEQQLLSREQFWLDLGYDKKQRCYNITPEAGRHPHFERMLHRTVIAPNGLEVSFTGIRAFCRDVGLRHSSFCEMLNGKVPSAQGWRLPKNKDQPIGQTLPKRYNVKLVDPNGGIHGPIVNLEEFCRLHQLQASSIRHLLAGRYQTSKGWRLAPRHQYSESTG